MILNLLSRKRFKTLTSLLEFVHKKSISKKSGFNIMIVRDGTTDLQIFHSMFLNNFTELRITEFGYAIVVLFESENDEYHIKFKELELYNMFNKLKDEIGYYYNCGNDIPIVTKIAKEFCSKVYSYNNNTKYEFKTEYPDL